MKIAALVLILLCEVVLGRREVDSVQTRYVSATRQSRGQSPASAHQQTLSQEGGQSVRYVTESPQPVNYAGSPHLIFRNPVDYGGSNSAANPSADEQLQSYDPQAFAASFSGKENGQTKISSQQLSYSPASDVSQFRYSSPLVKYSNLGVISQVTGEEALKSLQKSAESTQQQPRYPTQYITQSQGFRASPPENSENYASASAESQAQQSSQHSSGQQLQGEEPTSYEALLGQYYAQQQQQQHQKQQSQQHQLQLQHQQLQQQLQSDGAALQQQYSKAPGVQAIPSHLIQQGSQSPQLRAHYQSGVSPQYSAGISGRTKSSVPSGKNPGFAEQIAQFLGQFTLGSRGHSSQSAAGPQKFNNDIVSQQRSITPEQLAKQQYYLQQQQSSRPSIYATGQKQAAYPGVFQAQQYEAARAAYQVAPAGYSSGQLPGQYTKSSQQTIHQSPESQQLITVGPQGAYVVGPQGAHVNSVYASSHQPQEASAASAAYSEGQRSSVAYANAASQADYSPASSQTIYVPAQRATASAIGRSQLQSAAAAHSAYA